MLSTSSYSKTMIKENLSRYWAIPVLGLLGMILVGMLPIILNYKEFNEVAAYAAQTMMGSSFFVIGAILIIAVVASSAVFGYLHEPVSAGAVHSMPVNRNGLFGASVISGWILTNLPIVIFSVLMMFMRGATSKHAGPNPELSGMISGVTKVIGAKELFTLPHMLGFIIVSVVTATFAYAVACLAAVLSGRKGIHVLLAIFLFILPLTVAFQANAICSGYLGGFDNFDINYRLLNASAFAMSREDFRLEAGYLIYYIALSLVLLAAALWIYKRIKLERIGNATTFPVVGDVLAALLAVMCTLGFSQIVSWVSSGGASANAMRFAAVSVISSVVFYAIMRMIADSSFNIFNLRNLAKYGICLAVIALILVFTAFDITGYGKRMPEASEVASVQIETGFPQHQIEIDERNGKFDDPAAIEALLQVQRAAIEERDVKSDAAENYSEDMEITWTLKDGRRVSRRYELQVGKDYEKTNAALEKLYYTKSFQDRLHIDVEAEAKRSKSISFYADEIATDNWDGDYVQVRQEDYVGLLAAVDKDISSRKFEDIYTNIKAGTEKEYDDTGYISVELEYKKPQDEEWNTGRTYTLNSGEKHTRTFLKSKGYIK